MGKASKKQRSNTTANASQQQQQQKSQRPYHVVLIHLDLGIGGAEQLMLQLAQASIDAGYTLDIVTSRCEPNHCFAAVKPNGNLYPYLHVWGQWIPANIMGYGQAFCSTIRLLYLAYCVTRYFHNKKPQPDVIVLDVLPTPLALLQFWSNAALLFYCHFPDKLLIRDASGGAAATKSRSFYRSFLDWMEESTMALSDVTVVNSKFTQQTVLRTFPSLASHNNNNTNRLPVLYPALEIQPNTDNNDESSSLKKKPEKKLLVSLNRYERKKNLGLLIEAAAWMQQQQQEPDMFNKVEIVIAGGYDVKNVENVEYRGELQQLAEKLNVPVIFQQSISDAQRSHLLRHATAVVYTPENEHFGIVPLEAMYHQTPVVACNSGGPKETILNGTTGYLCSPTADAFGKALLKLLQMDDAQLEKMGSVAKKHVMDKFGPERLVQEWKTVIQTTVERGRSRTVHTRKFQYHMAHVLSFFIETAIVATVVICLTRMLRFLGILKPKQSILGKVKSVVKGDDEL